MAIVVPTPSVKSLAEAVVATEAFFDPVKNLLGLTSNKGKDYKPVEQKHTYNNKALITAIARQYGNEAWLRKQNWVYGNIKAGDILPFMVLGTAQAHPEQALEVASQFYLKVYEGWHKAVKAYYRSIAPAISALAKGLTDESLAAAQAALKGIPRAEDFFRSAPKIFPIMSRPLPKKHENLRPVRALNDPTRTRALKKDEVKALVARIIVTLDAAEKIREQIIADAEAAFAPAKSHKLYQLAHSKTPEVPKGSEASLHAWVEVAVRVDPTTIYWSSGQFTTTRTCYGDLVLAICHWIDRSIK